MEFSAGNNFAPRPELLAKVMDGLQHQESLAATRRRMMVFAVLTVLSAVAFVPAIWLLRQHSAASGFSEFLSLFFSDFRLVVWDYWQSFLLTLLEALPAAALIIFLAVLLLFLESLKLFVNNLKIVVKAKRQFNL